MLQPEIHWRCRDPTPKRGSSDTAHVQPSGASHADGPARRTPSPQKAPKPLLGKARTSAAAVSKILQIAQQNEQFHAAPSAGDRQGSPPAARPVFSRHSSARVENQRATYPGMCAFGDEPETSAIESSPPRVPPQLYSNLAPTSHSTPGNVPGVHMSSQLLSGGRRRTPQSLQGTKMPDTTDARVPQVFARLSAASQSPPPVVARSGAQLPEQSVQHAASLTSGSLQPAKAGTKTQRSRVASAYSPPPGSSRAAGMGPSIHARYTVQHLWTVQRGINTHSATVKIGTAETFVYLLRVLILCNR